MWRSGKSPIKVIQCRQMKVFFRLFLGMMAVALALGRPSIALANGGDWHLGGFATGIPIFVVWVGGGIIAVFFLFFLIGWVFSSRAKRLSQEGETESNSRKANGEEK